MEITCCTSKWMRRILFILMKQMEICRGVERWTKQLQHRLEQVNYLPRFFFQSPVLKLLELAFGTESFTARFSKEKEGKNVASYQRPRECIAKMECNKEDALKAKEMAEKKFKLQDIAGAKRFALKAQKLNPEIDGLPQMIATLDVYISAEKSKNGEIDFYRVLGVDPLADEFTIRNQFNKLAHVIHPDRNKSVGADGAFKILSEAWSCLSDKGRRNSYDQKRNLNCKPENILERQSLAPDGHYNVPNLSNSNVSNEGDYRAASQNGIMNLVNNNASNEREHSGVKHSQPSSDSSTPTKPTFWTSCNACKAQFEYHRNYLHRNLLCSNCRRPFHALEVPPPPIDETKPWASYIRGHSSGESAKSNSSSAQEIRPTSTTSIGRARLSSLNSSQRTSQAGLFSKMKDKVTERREKEISSERMRAATSTPSMGRGEFYGLDSSQKTFQAGLLSGVKEKRKDEVSAQSMTTTSTLSMGWAKLDGLDSPLRTSQAGLFSAVKEKEKKRGKKEVSVGGVRAPTLMTSVGRGKHYGLDSSQETSHADLFSEVMENEKERGKKEVSTESMRAPTSTTSLGWGRLYGLDSSWNTSQASEVMDKEKEKEKDRGKKAVSAESMMAPTSITIAGWGKHYGLESSWKSFQEDFFSEVLEKEKKRGKETVSAESMRVPTSVTDRWSWKRKFKEGALDGPEVTKTSSEVLKKLVSGVTSASSVAGLGTLPEGDNLQKRRRMTDQKMETSLGTGNGGVAATTLFGSQDGGTATSRLNMAGNYRLTLTRELSQKEARKMLVEKAKKVITGKLTEWRIAAVPKIPHKSKEMEENEKGKKEAAKADVQADMSKYREYVDTKKKESTGKIAPRKIGLSLTPNNHAPVSMTVADPDFYDFDKDRTERSFTGNQVWAAYDQEDGMPRYYVMIHYVISENPFRMRISWLNSKSNDEFGPLSCIASGFSKTVGEFQVGKHEIYGSLNSFSHQVKWTKGARGDVHIYPSKGDVWGLYRNWSPNWNERTPDDVIRKYDMVEVLEDYNEARGVSVYPLVKVVGFKTVFCRHWDPRKVMKIPRAEMFRFSHQVPSHFLTGNEGPNAPADSVELDPAATPLELLQVTKEARKEEKAEKPMEEDSTESSKSPKVQELVEHCELSVEKGLVQDAEKVVAGKNENEHEEAKLAEYNRRGTREGKTI